MQEAAIKGFGCLAGTTWQDAAKAQLLSRVREQSPRIRSCVARELGKFEGEEVRQALSQLREDEDHRVVGAVIEGLLSAVIVAEILQSITF